MDTIAPSMLRSLLLSLLLLSSGCAILSSSSSGDQSIKVTIEVCAAPPPDKVEKADARPSSPGYGYIWVNGNWSWTGYEWTWNPGHYVIDSNYAGEDAYYYND